MKIQISRSSFSLTRSRGTVGLLDDGIFVNQHNNLFLLLWFLEALPEMTSNMHVTHNSKKRSIVDDSEVPKSVAKLTRPSAVSSADKSESCIISKTKDSRVVERQKDNGSKEKEINKYINDGNDLFGRGQYEEATKLFQKALSKHQLEAPEERILKLAEIYLRLGTVLPQTGTPADKALEMLKEAHGIRVEALGNRHPDVAETFHHMGVSLYHQYHYCEAMSNHEQALAIRLEVFGNRHPDVAMSYVAMSLILSEQGKHKEAMDKLNEGLEIQLEVLGSRHEQVGTTYSCMAGIFGRQGKYGKAAEMKQQALEIHVETIGNRNPRVAADYGLIGMALHLNGDNKRAMKAHEKALDIQLEFYGNSHATVASTYRNMGDVSHARRHYESSRQFYEKALSIYLEVYTEDHKEVEITRIKLMNVDPW